MHMCMYCLWVWVVMRVGGCVLSSLRAEFHEMTMNLCRSSGSPGALNTHRHSVSCRVIQLRHLASLDSKLSIFELHNFSIVHTHTSFQALQRPNVQTSTKRPWVQTNNPFSITLAMHIHSRLPNRGPSSGQRWPRPKETALHATLHEKRKASFPQLRTRSCGSESTATGSPHGLLGAC